MFESAPQNSASKLRKLYRRYRQLPPNVLALSLVSFLNDLSSEIIYPLLPFFLKMTLGASPFAIGTIEGAAESASSLLKLFAGYFSDRFARRKSIAFVGYALSSFTRPFLGFATSWTQVLGVRLTDRLGKGIRSAPRDAIIADSIAPEKRGLAFGFHRAMDHAGAVVGPIIGFLLLRAWATDRQNPTADEYTQVFLVASIPAILSLLVVGFFVREKISKFKVQGSKSEETSDAGAEISAAEVEIPNPKTKFDNNFKRFLLVLILFTLSNSSDVFLLLRAEQCGISTVMIPLLWSLLHFVKVFSSLVGGDLSDRIGRKTLIFAGWILYAVVYAGFAFAASPGAAVGLFLLYGFYFGLTEGAEKALVTDLVPAGRRGTAFGWYHLAYGIAVFPASLAMGALWDYFGFQTAFLASAAISLTAAALLLTVQTKQPSAPALP